ncbi:hypothetical protein ABZ454_02640 [Streptomyces sp. NPDC005803]|uniref:hypothetical protein n=1 Tax=Streptomyces sp. NPDC005803 TaxID=3154297 RepID=UPI0033CDA2AE
MPRASVWRCWPARPDATGSPTLNQPEPGTYRHTASAGARGEAGGLEVDQPGIGRAAGVYHVLRTTAAVELTPGAYSIALQVNGRRFPAAGLSCPGAMPY